MEKKIVFINQDTGYLMIDIVNAFAQKFDKVALIAGSIRVQHAPLDNRVEYSKIIRYNRGSLLKKVFSWFWGTAQVFFLVVFKYRKYEIFYVTVPPTAYLLSYFLKRNFSVLVYDVYPDVLKTFNIRETNLIYKLWRFLNKKVFIKAYKIFTLSEGMAELLGQYAQRDKIIVIPNWPSDLFRPIDKKYNRFLLENHLLDKFIILYTGNIGYTHNVEVLIEAARKLRNENEVLFLIGGRGRKKEAIRKMVVDYKLANCKIIPFQAADMVPFLLAAADIVVVALNDEVVSASFPSRIYNFLAVGSPLLGIVHQKSEINELISKYNNGKSFDSVDINGMSNFILKLKSDKRLHAEYSNNSFKASKNFTRENAKLYLNHYV